MRAIALQVPIRTVESFSGYGRARYTCIRIISAPASANAIAAACPIPLVPPVTRAVWPSNENILAVAVAMVANSPLDLSFVKRTISWFTHGMFLMKADGYCWSDRGRCAAQIYPSQIFRGFGVQLVAGLGRVSSSENAASSLLFLPSYTEIR